MEAKIEINEKRLAVWQAFLQAEAKVVCALTCEMQQAQGFSLTWFHVLMHLDNEPGGGLRLQELAKAVTLSQSGLTRLLDRMAGDGLVERKPCSSDRRGSYAIITPKGQKALAQARPLYLQGIRTHFLQHLNDEDLEVLDRVFAEILHSESDRSCNSS